MIPEHLVDEVRQRADIVEIVGEQVQLKRAGKDFRALCPFHTEKTPSFYVVPAKGFYKCFGCGETGDAFTFLMKRGGLNFVEAVREVARRVGVTLPDPSDVAVHDDPYRALREALAFADDYFQRVLRESEAGEAARAYVESRGITGEAIDRFGIGLAPAERGALRAVAHTHGIDDAVLEEAGLIKPSEHGGDPYDRFRGRLTFPIRDLGGRTIAFGGRTLPGAPPGAPKYLNSPETPVYHKGRLLYGLNWSKSAIRREGTALVVEGYMDYVSLAARGIEHVVAALGTSMTDEQANLLARYTNRAVLLFDSDHAGLRAAFRAGDALLRVGVHPLVATLPVGEDPDSVARKSGADALRQHVANAPDVLERKLQMLDERGYFDDIEGARRALDRLLPTLRSVIDPALRDIYVARVAQRTGVRRETLDREIAAGGAESGWTGGSSDAGAEIRRPVTAAGNGERGRQAKRRQQAAERLFLLILLRDPRRISDAATVVAPEDLRTAEHRELYAALIASPDDRLEPAGLSPEARRAAEELVNDPTEVTDGDQSFEDAVADIKAIPLFLQIEALQKRLRAVPAEESADVVREIEATHRELRTLGGELGYKMSARIRRLARPAMNGEDTTTEES